MTDANDRAQENRYHLVRQLISCRLTYTPKGPTRPRIKIFCFKTMKVDSPLGKWS